MNDDTEARRRRLECELEQCRQYEPGYVRDAVIDALKDRLRALERLSLDTASNV